MAALASPVTAPAETPAKRDWYASTALHVRRRVLLQILLLLKTKYGKVDTKISYIARRAELALYTQAFSLDEYRNPKILNRRLHSLVIKLHMNNLAAREDQIFDVEGDGGSFYPTDEPPTAAPAAQLGKRPGANSLSSPSALSAHKRPRTAAVGDEVPAESGLAFSGNRDLLHQVCSFLSASDALKVASTSRNMYANVPLFVTTIQVSVSTLESLSPSTRTSFFDRFANLEHFEVHGNEESHLHFDFQNELALVRRNVVCRSLLVALARRPLSRLKRVRWHYAFVDGVHDRITSQIAELLLDPTKFPRLAELSLVGNAVSDDGVSFLCGALRRCQSSTAIKVLNLEQNFVGERGHRELEQLVKDGELSSSATVIAVKLKGNLLTPAPRSW